MADKKESTLVLIVDLGRDPCFKKIKKALIDCCEIQSQSFDEKQKKVTLSGPFEPEKLIKKLYCKVGCKIIISYEIPKPSSPAKGNGDATVSKPKTAEVDTGSKPKPAEPGPVNIWIGPIGPVCYCRPCRLPDCPDPGDCTCRPPKPTCQSRPCGSRGHCQCGGHFGGSNEGGHR